jgi:hypothetical protein
MGVRAVLCLVACACSTPSQAPAPAATPDPRPASPPDARATVDATSRSIDEAMREYVEHLPEATSLSEQNGASMDCAAKQYGTPSETYTHLYGLAERLPNNGDTDLVALVPWAHADDPCIRQIAIDAIVARIKLDRNRLSAPAMHEPDSTLFHEIMLELRDYLRAHNVVMPPDLFAGTFIDITPKDLAAFHGSWAEKANRSRTVQHFVELDATTLRVKTHYIPPSRNFPDSTVALQIKNVTIEKRAAFVITGTEARQPDVRTYTLMPVSKDVVWLSYLPSSWTRLERKR